MSDVSSFDRILVARHNPRNGCLADDEEWLSVAPIKAWPTQESAHWFIGAKTKQKSRYGWVHQLSEPVTLSDFMARVEGDGPTTFAFEELQLGMLSAAQRLDAGQPVAVEFVSRGAEQKQIHLLVHKVIFHNIP